MFLLLQALGNIFSWTIPFTILHLCLPQACAACLESQALSLCLRHWAYSSARSPRHVTYVYICIHMPKMHKVVTVSLREWRGSENGIFMRFTWTWCRDSSSKLMSWHFKTSVLIHVIHDAHRWDFSICWVHNFQRTGTIGTAFPLPASNAWLRATVYKWRSSEYLRMKQLNPSKSHHSARSPWNHYEHIYMCHTCALLHQNCQANWLQEQDGARQTGFANMHWIIGNRVKRIVRRVIWKHPEGNT